MCLVLKDSVIEVSCCKQSRASADLEGVNGRCLCAKPACEVKRACVRCSKTV